MTLPASSDLVQRKSEALSHLIDLLSKRQYEDAKSLLSEIQQQARGMGQSAQVSLLTAAYQICAACQDHLEEIFTFKQAYETAVNREYELRQQLVALLNTINEIQTEAADSSDNVTIEDSRPKGNLETKNSQFVDKAAELWHKFQTLLVNKEFVEPINSPLEFDAPQTFELLPPQLDKPPPDPQPNGKKLLAAAAKNFSDSPDSTPSLSIYCLGSFRVYIEDILIDEWSGNVGKTIFKYLLLNREVPVHRDVLMDIFWPDDREDSARRNLYQAIYSIRQALKKSGYDLQFINLEESTYLINPTLDLWLDSEAFLAHYQKGIELEHHGKSIEVIHHYEMAENLYGGDFLSEDIYEEWALVPRENIRMTYLEILSRLSKFYWEQHAYTNCIIKSRKILEIDNCREDAHRRLMLAYAKLGQRHLAIRQYRQCEMTLKEELNISPMPATSELYQMIQQAI